MSLILILIYAIFDFQFIHPYPTCFNFIPSILSPIYILSPVCSKVIDPNDVHCFWLNYCIMINSFFFRVLSSLYNSTKNELSKETEA